MRTSEVNSFVISMPVICRVQASGQEQFWFSCTDFNSYVTVDFADGAPPRKDGPQGEIDGTGPGVALHHDVA